VWNSPDIQLYDAAGNPVASNNLTAGTTYDVKVRVRNDTAFQANQAKVVFRWANFGVGGPFTDFHTDTLDVPPGGVDAEAPFTPGSTGHLCIVAEINHLEDVNPDNNKGQENLHVGPTSSPAKVCFLIWNLTKEPAAVYLEVRPTGARRPDRPRAALGNESDPPRPASSPTRRTGRGLC
jgi:hypothetical protein